MATNATQGPADGVRPRADDSTSDGSLLRLYRHGDQDAAQRLYKRYAHRLRALARKQKSPELARRVDDDDIVQSVFGSFFRKVKLGVYNAPAGEELWHLFMVLTLNKVRSKGVYHRAAKRDVRVTSGAEGIDRSANALATDSQACDLLRMAIDEALERLPKEHEQVIRLRMEGHEVGEIARAIVRSKRSVERILQEGRDRLGKLLDD
jgi:RNA polymerase sigma-70 factor (ECF subfamily)